MWTCPRYEKGPISNQPAKALGYEALHNPEGVEAIIHPAPSKSKEEIILGTMEICGRTYPIIGFVVREDDREVYPIVDVPMMSDYKQQYKALQDRLEHPEKYRAIGEDVEAAVAQLRHWLEERSEGVAG